MKANSYRNPNEAIEYLKDVRAFMASIVNYNAVSIATSSVSKVRVINLENLDPIGGSSFSPSQKNRKSLGITRSSDTITLPRASAFGDSDFQHLLRITKEYKQSIAIYRDLNDKRAEWAVLWANNPHLEKLMVELDETLITIREALQSLRRKMTTSAKHYCPLRVQSIVADVAKYISSIPHERLVKSVEVTFPDEEDPTIVSYRYAFKLAKMKTHSTKVIKQYIIAITYIVNTRAKTATGYLNTMLELDPNADLGGSFKTAEGAVDLLNTYMDLDKIDVNPGLLPFPNIPSLNKDNLGMDVIDTLDLDPDTNRLYVRTNRFLDAEEQDDILHAVLQHIPDYLKHGQLRIDIAVEAYVQVASISDRNKRMEFISSVSSEFENSSVRHLGTNPTSQLEVYSKSIGFKVSNQELPLLKRFIVKYPGVTVKKSGIRSVFSFAVGAGKRSDIRSLRKFIDSISEELPPDSVMKVRKALGV